MTRKGVTHDTHSEQNTTRPGFVCFAQPARLEEIKLPPHPPRPAFRPPPPPAKGQQVNHCILINHSDLETTDTRVEQHFAKHGIEANVDMGCSTRLRFSTHMNAATVAKAIKASPLSSVTIAKQPVWCSASFAQSVSEALTTKRKPRQPRQSTQGAKRETDPHNDRDALDAKIEPPKGPSLSGLESLVRRIAPADIASRPVYIALVSDMPVDLRPSDETFGFHATFLDIVFRQWLADAGRWRGRGPCFVINDRAILADATERAGDDAGLRDELYRTRMLATVLHEASHVLTSPLDLRPVPDEIRSDVEKSSRAAVVEWIADKPLPADAEFPPQWAGHEAGFIRTLLHVHHRAEQLGIERLPDNFLFSNSNYSLSGLWSYRRALSREIDGFDSSLTFADLRACSPPQEFVELWRDDLHRWWKWMDHAEGPVQIAAAMAPYVHVLKAD